VSHIDLRQVFDSGDELLGVGAADFFFETALLGEEIKELATFCEFQDNNWPFLLGTVSDLDSGLRS
jgi:hypothetical protein